MINILVKKYCIACSVLFDIGAKKRYYIDVRRFVFSRSDNKNYGGAMEIGISTGCLYPELTENSIRILTELGFKRLEVFFNTFSEMEIDYLDRLKRLLDSHGARVVSVHPFISSFESFMLFSAYER